MSYRTSFTDVPASFNRSISSLLLAAGVLGLTMFCAPPVNAQTGVAYLKQIPVLVGKQKVYPIPAAPLKVGVGNYGPFNLPGYSSFVYMSLSCPVSKPNCQVPDLTWSHSKDAENQKTSNALFDWGADTDILSLSNMSSSTETYTLTFYFTATLAPDPSDLFLVVDGLKDGTTATLSGTNASGPAILGTTNGGEYSIPSNSSWSWCWPSCVSTAPTVFPGSKSGTLAFSHGVGWNSKYDPRNTGWDLYQPKSPGLRVLSLDVSQVSGDGMAFTLGYRVCSTLLGSDWSYPNGTLYDINTTTGAATNPRTIGYGWAGIAFSPTNGQLYGLALNGGTPVSNALFTINPYSGATTLVGALGMFVSVEGDVSVDPTSGLLYGVDGTGALFTVDSSTGTATLLGYVKNAGDLSAMAFDSAGTLFIVDTMNALLLTVDKSNAAVLKSVKLSPSPGGGVGGLAFDPLSGTAYFASGSGITDNLYTLNTSTGVLKLVGPLTGTRDGLYGLTFRRGACQSNL